MNAHPKGKFGAPGYDLAQFGLDAGELAERFSGYIAVPARGMAYIAPLACL